MYFFDHTLCFFGRLLFEVRRFTAAICQPASAEQRGTETSLKWALRQRLPRSKGTALSLFIFDVVCSVSRPHNFSKLVALAHPAFFFVGLSSSSPP
jgi:hypothetical protein